MWKKGKVAAFYFMTIVSVLIAAQWGSRAVTVIAQNIPVERSSCIVIDAGHGGEDGGATSCTGLLESQYNLQISKRLNDLLRFLGYKTIMIRTTDTSVYTTGTTIAEKKVSDLKRRVQTVNETENALLISIHQNNFSDGRYSGAQVFFAPTKGSEALAKQMQSIFVSTLNPGSNRKCKQSSGVYLMSHIDCPGVLVECGFLSNPEEEVKLRNGDYQKKLCCVIASSVSDFLSNT